MYKQTNKPLKVKRRKGKQGMKESSYVCNCTNQYVPQPIGTEQRRSFGRSGAHGNSTTTGVTPKVVKTHANTICTVPRSKKEMERREKQEISNSDPVSKSRLPNACSNQ